MLRPRHVLPLLLTLILAGVFVRAGFWQLDRREVFQAEAARLDGRINETPLAATDLPEDPDAAQVDDLEFRRVTAAGYYAPESEVLIRSRQRAGVNGWHVLTPLVTPRGTFLVNRGWVPYEQDEPPVAVAAPPDDEVTVTGYLLRTEVAVGFGPKDPETGDLQRVFRVDIDRLADQMPGTPYPMYVQLSEQSPAQADRLPDVAPPPDSESGNNLIYAIQWFAFALSALVAVGAFTRKRLRAEAAAPDAEAIDADA